MNEINDGGPAFPGIYEGSTHPDAMGMTMRDYFAAKADVSIYGPADALTTKLGRLPSMKELAEYVAQLRWLEADAMLAARGAQ
ncbi:hypothetical protein [Achromobacter ruhlandii]|uniref:hypothetical protein n=1 Tax=Achromobacter ruhlandii TaxID=72557 RepID=UPI0007BF4C45|nr:hypothetical protein [Achromobacter ruhlandii]